jgi:hypothetical protein
VPVHNASDPKQVKDRADKANRDRKQELEDVRYLVKTPAGKRYFRKILERGSVFTTTFTGNSRTFFNEGMRNLALGILADVSEAAPEAITELMIRNDTEEEEKENARD